MDGRTTLGLQSCVFDFHILPDEVSKIILFQYKVYFQRTFSMAFGKLRTSSGIFRSSGSKLRGTMTFSWPAEGVSNDLNICF